MAPRLQDHVKTEDLVALVQGASSFNLGAKYPSPKNKLFQLWWDDIIPERLKVTYSDTQMY